MSDFEKLNELIASSHKILITSHENPDGDALGSMLALGLGLKKLGKDVVLYCKDGVPETLEFLPNSAEIVNSLQSSGGPFDIAFAVDCTGTYRAGKEFERYAKSDKCANIVIIDHHETTGSEADIHILDKHASSTGVIIYRLLKSLDVEIDKSIATNIYTTIISDTGSFNYSNTNSETFSIAADLVERGVAPSEISQALYENEPLRKLELFKLAIPTLEITPDKKIALVHVDADMFRKSGTSRQDTEGLVNVPRSIKGVEVAVMLRQEADSLWKISLRSKGGINVAKIAESFGGGGHTRAAGCSLSGNIAEVKSKIISSIKGGL